MPDILIIKADASARRYWAELWSYRELLLVLAWRDIAVRYKQTVVGVLWALLQPLLMMLVFTLIFGRFARFPSPAGAPYAILVFSGLLGWNLFATSLADSSNSLIANASLVSKVYFPRMIVPAAAVVTAIVDFLISLCVLAALMIWYRFVPGWQIVLLPIFVFMAALTALGPGLVLASLNVKFRDFRYIIPFIVQIGLYVSPVGFSASVVPEQWQLVYSLNPMVAVIDGMRWCILGSPLRPTEFFVGAAVIAGLLGLGIFQFRREERQLADLI